MIDSVLNLLSRCSHKRLTRPITPATKFGDPQGSTYVVCLDCGKQFVYDTNEMRIGKPIDRSDTAGVLPAKMPTPRKTTLGYALLAAIPAAVVLGAVLKGKNKKVTAPQDVQSKSANAEETMRRDG